MDRFKPSNGTARVWSPGSSRFQNQFWLRWFPFPSKYASRKPTTCRPPTVHLRPSPISKTVSNVRPTSGNTPEAPAERSKPSASPSTPSCAGSCRVIVTPWPGWRRKSPRRTKLVCARECGHHRSAPGPRTGKDGVDAPARCYWARRLCRFRAIEQQRQHSSHEGSPLPCSSARRLPRHRPYAGKAACCARRAPLTAGCGSSSPAFLPLMSVSPSKPMGSGGRRRCVAGRRTETTAPLTFCRLAFRSQVAVTSRQTFCPHAKSFAEVFACGR